MEYYRTWAQINLDHIRHNLNLIRKLAGEEKIAAVVKANAYGHGAREVARAVEDGCDFFAAACAEEAMELKEAGIRKPVLILGYTPPCQYGKLIAGEIRPTIYSVEDAALFNREAERQNRTADIFISVDTGMTRIGFPDSEDGAERIGRIRAMEQLRIEGISSHLASADEEDPASSLCQFRRFESFLSLLKKRDPSFEIPIKTVCNSAGAMAFSPRYGMIRPGIALYGLYPSDSMVRIGLLPALELKTHIIQITEADKGCGVSYGHTYITDKKTKIATLSAGYADGVPRLLSNRGRVIINGQYAPIVGRVCMDLMMVDLTGIRARVGDTATVIGRDGEKSIPAEEVASLAQTIPYEIVCGISARVKRSYILNGKVMTP